MKSPITKSPNHEMLQCVREADVLDALTSARWPNRVDAELSAHVASCDICQDVLTVASAMREDHEAAWADADVPSSGQMWWRAEMRARQDAVREATRPVAVAQGVAALLVLVVAAAGAWVAWPAIQRFFAAVTLEQLPPIVVPLAVAMLALIVVAPVALYFVLSEK